MTGYRPSRIVQGVKWWTGVAIDWLLPRQCVMCGLPAGAENICEPCRADLPWTASACRRCGLPLPGEHAGVCGPCTKKPPPWTSVLAALDYKFPADALIRRFKFNRNMACGDALARALCEYVGDRVAVSPELIPDVIVPVPLHRSRLAARSFNQSEIIARHLGGTLGIPVDARWLIRPRKTGTQSGMDAKSRRRNTRGAFHCRRRHARSIHHAALVDDVMTTGATLEACTRELKRAGVKQVSLWVLARAAPP